MKTRVKHVACNQCQNHSPLYPRGTTDHTLAFNSWLGNRDGSKEINQDRKWYCHRNPDSPESMQEDDPRPKDCVMRMNNILGTEICSKCKHSKIHSQHRWWCKVQMKMQNRNFIRIWNHSKIPDECIMKMEHIIHNQAEIAE